MSHIPRLSLSGILRHIPTLLTSLAAITYGSGFLCVYVFLDHYGIHETSGDFLRARYIYVGILIVLFPLSFLLPMVMTISARHGETKMRAKERKDKEAKCLLEGLPLPTAETPEEVDSKRVKLSTIFIGINALGVLYIWSVFLPLSVITAHQGSMATLLTLTIIGPVIILKFVKLLIVPHLSAIVSRILRWALLLPCIMLFDYLCIAGYRRQLLRVLWGDHGDGAMWYFLLFTLIPLTIWRTNKRASTLASERSRVELQVGNIGFNAMIYFVGVVTFALRVYPNIPLSHGGGDYTEAPIITIHLRNTDLLNTRFKSMSGNYIMIEQTPSAIFVASSTDKGGPTIWRTMLCFPNVIEVPRDVIERLDYCRYPQGGQANEY